MEKLQILVTTMHQKDLALAEKMNIKSSTLIANQSDKCEYIQDGDIEMVTTRTRGLSKNRNIALSYADSDAEYIMFLDDDVVLNDGYEQLIFEEIKKHPEADAIKFSTYNFNRAKDETRKYALKEIKEFHKATRRKIAASGVCGLVVKHDVLIRKNFKFNESFGSGTEDYCGEDTIFLQDLFKRKVKLYFSPIEIGGIDRSGSTWFEGYTEKYFYVSGKILAVIYPCIAYLLAIRSAYRFSRRDCGMSFKKILANYWRGIYKQLHS